LCHLAYCYHPFCCGTYVLLTPLFKEYCTTGGVFLFPHKINKMWGMRVLCCVGCVWCVLVHCRGQEVRIPNSNASCLRCATQTQRSQKRMRHPSLRMMNRTLIEHYHFTAPCTPRTPCNHAPHHAHHATMHHTTHHAIRMHTRATEEKCTDLYDHSIMICMN
jgi:hypothetical protein